MNGTIVEARAAIPIGRVALFIGNEAPAISHSLGYTPRTGLHAGIVCRQKYGRSKKISFITCPPPHLLFLFWGRGGGGVAPNTLEASQKNSTILIQATSSINCKVIKVKLSFSFEQTVKFAHSKQTDGRRAEVRKSHICDVYYR